MILNIFCRSPLKEVAKFVVRPPARLAVMVALNIVRVFAVLFLMLAAEGRLTWGDIITGIVAVPVLWLLKDGAARYSTAIATWNLFGAADLVLAIAFGITSSEDSPCN